MLLSTSARNLGVGAITTNAGFVGLASAWPTDDGSVGELTGGTYTRSAIVWGAAASGQSSATTQPTLNVPAGSTIRFVTLWSALAAGTYRGCAPIGGSTPRSFTALADDTVYSPGHGYANTTALIVIQTGAGSLPTGLTEGTTYYVVNSATDTFKLAATSGGSPIDISAGVGFVTTIVPETYAAAGTFQITTDIISLNQ